MTDFGKKYAALHAVAEAMGLAVVDAEIPMDVGAACILITDKPVDPDALRAALLKRLAERD